MRLLSTVVVFLIISLPLAGAQAASDDVIITVDSSSLRFSPSEVTVEEGQAVRFMWSGQALPHNAVADDGTFDSGEPARDVDYRVVFEIGTAGSYPFECEPHASVGMVGVITVEPSPVIVAEEVPVSEPEQTPAVSMLSSVLLLVLVAVKYRSEDENSSNSTVSFKD